MPSKLHWSVLCLSATLLVISTAVASDPGPGGPPIGPPPVPMVPPTPTAPPFGPPPITTPSAPPVSPPPLTPPPVATPTVPPTGPIPVPTPPPTMPVPEPSQPPLITPTPPNLSQIRSTDLAHPKIQVWRASGTLPQIPARRGNYMLPAYVADNQAVLVHLMFDPRMAGKKVAVRRGLGAIVDPYVEVLQILPTGNCTLNVRLDETMSEMHLIFHCDGIRTILPFTLTSAQIVAAAEQAAYRPAGL